MVKFRTPRIADSGRMPDVPGRVGEVGLFVLSARATRAPFGSATGVVVLGGIFPKLTGVVGAVFETFLGPSFSARGVCW